MRLGPDDRIERHVIEVTNGDFLAFAFERLPPEQPKIVVVDNGRLVGY